MARLNVNTAKNFITQRFFKLNFKHKKIKQTNKQKKKKIINKHRLKIRCTDISFQITPLSVLRYFLVKS